MSPRVFVVGGAGFIGSHLVDAVLASDPAASVTIYDNLSVGKAAFVETHLASGRAVLVEDDALDLEALTLAMAGHDACVHLAANPEARWGLERTRLDLEQGTIATYNVLEAMRRAHVPVLAFSSSGTVYGDSPTPKSELDLGHLPISLYGASKLAGEAMISAFTECFGLRATILRFGNVVGPRGTHGAALDFLKKLAASAASGGPTVELEVLGDGKQSKPYLHVSDCVGGILFALRRRLADADPDGACAVFNLAPPDQTSVARIAALCVAASPYPTASIRFTGGDRGWPGDVPRSTMVGDRLRALGYALSMTSDQAVERAIAALAREVFPA